MASEMSGIFNNTSMRAANHSFYKIAVPAKLE
jgi:hypothetical protein